VLVVALLIGLAVVSYLVFGTREPDSRSQSFAIVTGQGEHSESGGVVDSDPEYLETVAAISKSREQQTYSEPEGKEDPLKDLIAASDAVGRAQKAPPPVVLPYMKLNGIVWDPKNPVVMIDGIDLRKGDSIKGAKVVEIRPNEVALEYKSKRFVLTVD
jgi:hypothetical protein